MKIILEVDVEELRTNPKGEDQRFRIQVKVNGQLFERETKVNQYNRMRFGLSGLVSDAAELSRLALMHGGLPNVETSVWDYAKGVRLS